MDKTKSINLELNGSAIGSVLLEWIFAAETQTEAHRAFTNTEDDRALVVAVLSR